MRKRITLLVAALMLALTMAFGSVAAFAAPITCPGKQQPERVGGQWVYVNPADNPSGAAKTKNPND